MPYEERPNTRRTRVVIISVLWLLVGFPILIGLQFWTSWLLWILVALSVWASADYVRRGGMFEAVDSASRVGAHVPRAWSSDVEKRDGRTDHVG